LKDEAKVFIVDDDPSILRSMTRALVAAEWRVEAFSSAAAFLARSFYDGIGCVIADLRMPGMDGLELQNAFIISGYSMPLIFLSAYGDVPTTVKAMKAGAVDFLTKPVPMAGLLQSVEMAVARHREILANRSENEKRRHRWLALTPREKEVALLVGRGLMNKVIAAELGAAEATIKIHRGRAMQKLGAASVPDLLQVLAGIGIA
jgi:FixJ family two-component response regulator